MKKCIFAALITAIVMFLIIRLLDYDTAVAICMVFGFGLVLAAIVAIVYMVAKSGKYRKLRTLAVQHLSRGDYAQVIPLCKQLLQSTDYYTSLKYDNPRGVEQFKKEVSTILDRFDQAYLGLKHLQGQSEVTKVRQMYNKFFTMTEAAAQSTGPAEAPQLDELAAAIPTAVARLPLK